MTRWTFAILVAAMSGCSGDTVITHGPFDGGAKAGDLGAFINPGGNPNPGAGDLSLPENIAYGCASFSTCMTSCLSAQATATLSGCETTCGKNVKSPSVPTTWEMMLACGQTWCLDKGVTGGPNYKCMLDSSMTMLIDATGMPAMSCATCLTDSLADVFGSACTNPGGVDCNPSACAGAVSACLSDTP